jgi:Transposase DDE domain group 1
MTQCTGTSLAFGVLGSREVVGRFDGGTITSDGGGLLLREVNRRLGLLNRLAACFVDGRDAERTEHSVEQLLAQRIYGLALGYEDLNDHDRLRADPLLAVLAGSEDPGGSERRNERDRGKALAGKSTLNRLELSVENGEDRYKKVAYKPEAIDRLLVDVFLEAHETAPEQIIIDLDATDLPVYGHQEKRFFHGFYNSYCYLPLYIVSGEHLLGVRLRASNIDASAGALTEIERIVKQIRERWPQVRIILRADSGFCRDALMSWCEGDESSGKRADFVFGFARNERLRQIIEPQMQQAAELYRQTGKAARVFAAFTYQTRDSWSQSRRVVAKAEQIEGKENPRYIVTSLTEAEWDAQQLYEELYCARGDMENRIKEQLSLFADRVSAATMRANQLRLYLAAAAYVLMHGLRRLGLAGTELARAQCATIRNRLLKIGAQVRITVRKVWIALASSYPGVELFIRIHRQLRC